MGFHRKRRQLCLIAAVTLAATIYWLITHWTQQRPPSAFSSSSSSSSSSIVNNHLQSITGYSARLQFHSVPRYTCTSTKVPSNVQYHNGHWQVISANRSTVAVYLFSAHLDLRLKVAGESLPYVRVVAVAEGGLSDKNPIHCQIWQFRNSTSPSSVVLASAQEIWLRSWDPGGGGAKRKWYTPYLVSCPAYNDTAVWGVSLTSAKDPCERATNLLLVHQPTKRTYDFAMCVKGLDFAEDISLALVEWIELHSLLGVDVFTFYQFHVHPNVSRVLDYYRGEGKVQKVDLSLPGPRPNSAQERTRYLRRNVWQKRRDELVPYNDCFYRHHRQAKFVVPLDVDEVIVPVKHDTWTEMIQQLTDQDPDILARHASLSAQQVYFFDEEGSTTAPRIVSAPTSKTTPLLGRTRRTSHPTPAGHGVKSLVVTANALTVFNHYALHPLPSPPGLDILRHVLLPSRLVRLHHYKAACPQQHEGDRCAAYLSRMVTDTLLLDRYSSRIVPRVRQVLNVLDLL